MPDFFRAFEAQVTRVPTFFIESTAPNNVDGEVPSNASKPPPDLTEIDPDRAIEKIAQTLASGQKPNLVVMVHGYNNPRDVVLRMYRNAAIAIDKTRKYAAIPQAWCV